MAAVNATITEIVKAEIASASGNYFGATQADTFWLSKHCLLARRRYNTRARKLQSVSHV
jgi:hypothetical protein